MLSVSGAVHPVLKYSPRAAKAIASLKKHYNDIDVFVEDTGNHNMWLLIVKNILPNVKIESVNMLGGRDIVTKSCELDQINTGRKKLYIVDGDFDFLLGRKKKNLKYFYRIRANNIENILFTENSMLGIALEQQPMKSPESLMESINFENSFNELETFLRPLFVAYAVVQKLYPSLQTTGYSVRKLIQNSNNGPSIDILKLRSRIFCLYLKLCKLCGFSEVKKAREEIKRRSASLPICQIASGKDYILPLTLLRFQKNIGYPGNDEKFKVALARSFQASQEPYLARRLRNLKA